MGYKDNLFDHELGNLPPEAFNPFDADMDGPFDPQNDWLENAHEEDQLTAMREWFLARYCDPALETPYIGREGGYIFIHGGPYDPADVLHDRFFGLVPDELIQKVVDEMHAEVGDSWAPISRIEDYYDEYLRPDFQTRDGPRQSFLERQTDIDRLLSLQTDETTASLMHQMLYGSIISAIEAYLADTVAFWVKEDAGALRGVVSNAKEFKDKKISYSEIFDRLDAIETEILDVLANQVWHRLDKLSPMITNGLAIKMPDIADLMKAVEIRHDIVHRAGKTKNGEAISIDTASVIALRGHAMTFVLALEQELERRFPRAADF